MARLYLVTALLGALAVAVFLPAASQLFLRDPAYRTGSDVVLILLAANVCLGLYYNFSVWYKVTDATGVGAVISVGGALLTIALNVAWIPRFGFYGCAWATLVCYAAMMATTYLWGQRRYPVPYHIGAMVGYSAAALALAGAAYVAVPALAGRGMLELAVDGGDFGTWALVVAIGSTSLLGFCVLAWTIERRLGA